MSAVPPPFPSDDEILAFIASCKGVANLRVMTRHFRLTGEARQALKMKLRDLERSGRLAKPGDRPTRVTLPETITLQVVGFSPDNEAVGEPVDERHKRAQASIVLDAKAQVAVGDRVVARLTELKPGHYIAKVLRKHAGLEKAVLGTFHRLGQNRGGHIHPLDPDRIPRLFFLPQEACADLKDGMVLLAQPIPGTGDNLTPPTVELLEVVGDQAAGLESLIAIDTFEIPNVFPENVLAESESLPAKLSDADIAEREDLRALPIITIDGADARDFDDAVWAEDWRNGGFHIVVAIADVAHYIAEGGALDKEAFKRGNSVYFPDRVVPMLPERLSNDLCSLRPHEDRPVLAVHLYVDADGQLRKHKFSRAVIHSHARLTYEQVQDALDGTRDSVTEPLWPTTLEPLYRAYKTLLAARSARGALDLDVPEKKIIIGPGGEIETITRRDRKESHRLIEEMMILANVAAATALEGKNAPCLYRVHPEPSAEKMENLKTVLRTYGLTIERVVGVRPEHIQGLIEKIKGREEAEVLYQVILRSQQQAHYSPENVGHFGLSLERYAHFTSPIRRYSDLMVHRSLVKTLDLPGKGALKTEMGRFYDIADHLAVTERRAQQAEWDAADRFITRFYSGAVGETFPAQVMSVLKFGMFVNIQGGLAEGLVPLALMGNDRFGFDPKRNELTGQRSRRTFRVGNRLTVTLVEANPVLGKLTFALGKVDVASLPPREHRGPRMGGADRPRPARPPQQGGDRPFRPREGFGPKHFNKPPRREWTEQEDLRLEGVDELPTSETPAPYGQRRDERPAGDKPRGERPQGDRPRRAWNPDGPPRGDRPQGDRPRRAWNPDGPPPREGGGGFKKRTWNPDGPPKGDRPQGDRPRRAWNPDGPPRGDRPQGDRPRRAWNPDGPPPREGGGGFKKRAWNPDGPPKGDRPQGDRPRRAWNPDGPPPREGGGGFKKRTWNPDGPPRGDRPQGDRPRRAWNPDGPPPREGGGFKKRAWNPDGPPRGDRPQGERPARGKSFGKPGGDRPRGKPDFAKRDGGKPSFSKGPRKPGGPKGPPRGRKPRP